MKKKEGLSVSYDMLGMLSICYLFFTSSACLGATLAIEANSGEEGYAREYKSQSIEKIKDPYSPKPFTFFTDVLYMKAIEDGLRYAETNSFTFSPPGNSIEQDFNYEFGVRVGVTIPIKEDELSCGIIYTRYHAEPDCVTKIDSQQFIFACLGAPTYLPYGNTQCGYVRGAWKCNLDKIDIEIKKPIIFSKSFFVFPLLGVSSAIITQRVDVSYRDYFIVTGPSFGTAQSIVGKSRTWGCGSFIGASGRFSFLDNVGFVFRGTAALMCGSFDATTRFGEFTSSDIQDGFIRENANRLFTLFQLQAGLSAKFLLKEKVSLDIALGWESQIWSNQMRMTWYSTIPSTKEGNLTLYGPFADISLGF